VCTGIDVNGSAEELTLAHGSNAINEFVHPIEVWELLIRSVDHRSRGRGLRSEIA
jgi:hypothetical protein